MQILHNVVLIPSDVKHWHGASSTIAMTHVALVETVEGESAAWMEQVRGAQCEEKNSNRPRSKQDLPLPQVHPRFE